MKSIQRIAAILLALALLLGLAGCGKKEEERARPSDPAAAETGEPGLRYQAAFTALRSGLRSSLMPLLYTDGGFYAQGYDKVGQRPLGEGVEPAYEGQYDLYQYRLYYAGTDGSLRLLENYSPAYLPENTEGYASFSASSSICGLFFNTAGQLEILENTLVSYYDGPEGLTENDEEYWQYFKMENYYYLRCLDENGGELRRVQPELTDCMYANEGCVQDAEGNILFSYMADNGDSCVAALAEDGSQAYRLTVDGYVSGLARLGNGQPAVLGDLPGGWGLQVIDDKAKSLGESYSLPADVSALLPGDERFDFYYTSGTSLYGYRLEEEESMKVLNWLDCDVDVNAISAPCVRPDGTVLAVENDWDGDMVTASLVTLNQVSASAVEQKQVLTLAAVAPDFYMQSAVIAFNRKSEDTRIQVNDYSQYNTGPEDTAGLTKLTTEILSGNTPDLLALSGLPYDQLAAKGLLEDLYPWLDGDGALKREDFFPSVLGAMEVGGGLYQVCPYFSISSVVGPRDLVGDRNGWTYEDLYEALAALPEGSTIFSPRTTKAIALDNCLTVSMDSLVDWASGTCRFDSEDFLALLEYANRFPAEVPEDTVSNGPQLLRSVSIDEFRSMAFDEMYFGGQGSTVYIGYPTFDGSCGSAIDLDSGYAMSASCADKEAAWEFLRIFMTADYQTSAYRLPSNRSQFEKTLAQAMTPTYELDESGNYVLDENGERVQEPIVYFDGIPIYCTTQDQAERLTSLVEHCDKAVRPAADSIRNIVAEDAQAYFAGQKTAQEAARLIQSKVSLYMGEQS